MSDDRDTTSSPPHDPPDPSGSRDPDVPAPWPPPGLERMQGDLWGVVDRLGIGALILTVPFLAALTLPQDPWESGIYGDAWWIVVGTSLVGIWILLAGHVHLFRALRRWRSAVRSGYSNRTVALVLADRPGDTGFLVQGLRAYSLVGRRARRWLLGSRLVRVSLMVAFGLWLSAGFVALVALSARGALGERGLALWTLVPPAVVLFVVAALAAWESSTLARARKRWHARGWTSDLALTEIEEWHAAVGRRRESVAVLPGTPRRGGGLLRGAAAATVLVALAVLGGSAAMVVFASMGPVLSEIALPRFSRTHVRAAKAEMLRQHRLPTDSSVTGLQAGEALVSLAGRPRADDLLLEPPRSHEPLFGPGDEDNPTGVLPRLWARDLVPRLADGLDPAALSYLRSKAEHPALAELSVLARGAALADLDTTPALPFPPDASIFELPIPRYRNVREAASASIGVAVAEAAAGRTAAAETRIREVISAGLLLGDEGSTLITNLIGHVLVEEGATALANLWEATGRPDDAAALRASIDAAERGSSRALRARLDVSDMPDVVVDTTAIRGLRWELANMLHGLGPCLNMNRVVFGAPDGYASWSGLVDARLARTDGEEALLDLSRRGFVPDAEAERSLLTRLFAAFAGPDSRPCTALLGAVNY